MVKRPIYTIALSIAILLSVGTLTSYANNHSDTSFDFTIQPQSSTPVYTSSRPKYDNSSAYMKLQYISSGSYYAKVVDKNGNDFSRTWTYLFDSSDVNYGRYLFNYAYEDRGYGVLVKIKGTRGPISPNIGVRATGVWSPDSI